MKDLLKLEWVRYVLIGLIGAAVGAVFYPSKTITKEERTRYEQTISTLENEKRTTNAFYQDQYNKEVQSNKQYREEVAKKVDTLKEENYKLSQKISEKRFKIVKPDGTIEEKWFKDSQTDIVSSTVTSIKEEFTRKVSAIESKWMKVHEKKVKELKDEYEKKLSANTTVKSETVKKEKTEINERNFGISLGIMFNKNYYSNISYDVYGPFFLDLHVQSGQNFSNKEAGVGIGMRF